MHRSFDKWKNMKSIMDCKQMRREKVFIVFWEPTDCKQVYERPLPGDVAVGALLMGDFCEGCGSSLYSVA